MCFVTFDLLGLFSAFWRKNGVVLCTYLDCARLSSLGQAVPIAQFTVASRRQQVAVLQAYSWLSEVLRPGMIKESKGLVW